MLALKPTHFTSQYYFELPLWQKELYGMIPESVINCSDLIVYVTWAFLDHFNIWFSSFAAKLNEIY